MMVLTVVVVVEFQCMDNNIERVQSGKVLYARLRQWARSLHFKCSQEGLSGEEKGETLGKIL